MRPQPQPQTVNPAGAPTITPVPGSTGPGEFDRFEDLAGKLVQVPKKELDEKLAKP